MNVILMGVSGTGKTTLGRALAEASGGIFRDGDDFHPPENKARMAAGVPLGDSDRRGWLAAIAACLAEHARHDEASPLFIACSALKRDYRARLRKGDAHLRFLFLHGDTSLIERRLKMRKGHFMSASLLHSQLEILEFPQNAIDIPIDQPVKRQVQIALNALKFTPRQ